MTKQEFKPLTKEQYNSIKPGDVIERMLAFAIPCYLIVQKVDDKIIDAGWTFDRNTGLEVDEDITSPASYISKILNEEEKEIIKNGGKLAAGTPADHFAKETWDSIEALRKEGKNELLLVHLYLALIKQIKANIPSCDSFLKYTIEEIDMSTDEIVHILNALSPVKQMLTNWEAFKEHCTKKLLEKVGPDETAQLLQVIV